MTWTEIASEFEWDGTLRDIYVVDTTLDDWQRILDALIEHKPNALAFYLEKEEAASIPSAKVIFELSLESSTLLQVTLGNVHLNCHFFCEEQVEFDLDPSELRGEEDLQGVVGFMRILANETGKPVILTHENMQDAVILTIQPPGAVPASRPRHDDKP